MNKYLVKLADMTAPPPPPPNTTGGIPGISGRIPSSAGSSGTITPSINTGGVRG